MSELLTRKDVARTLKVSDSTVRRLIQDGRLPAVRIGKSVRVRPSALSAFVEAHEAVFVEAHQAV
jgi:excisionase family DNA binding protein